MKNEEKDNVSYILSILSINVLNLMRIWLLMSSYFIEL